mgnify:FL=1
MGRNLVYNVAGFVRGNHYRLGGYQDIMAIVMEENRRTNKRCDDDCIGYCPGCGGGY